MPEDAGEDEVHGRDDGGEDFYRGHRADDGAPAAAVLEEVHARRDDAEDAEGEGDEYQPGRQRDHDDAGHHVQDHDRAEAVPRLHPVGEIRRERCDARGVGPDPVPSRHRVQGRVQALAEVRVLARRDRHPDGNARGDRVGDDARRRRARLDRDHLDGDGHEAFNAWMSDRGNRGRDAFNTAPRGGRGRAAESGLARVPREGRVGGSVRHVERAIRESARARRRAFV